MAKELAGEEETAASGEKSDKRGDADFWKKLSDGDALAFGGGGDAAFGGAHVGAAA